MDTPGGDLYRSTPPMEVRAADDGRLTLYGHFSVFDTPTVIDSVYEGRFIERIAPGAFSKTISERANQVRIMWNHGRSEILPDVPIAKPLSIREDERGGYYEASLFRGLPEWLYEGLAEGQYGASFRFQPVRDEWDDNPVRSESNPDGLPERIVREAKLFELGPVSWPAYAEATSGVRSLSDRFHDLRTLTAHAANAPEQASAAPTTTTDADDSASHFGGLTPAQREYALRAVRLS